MKENKNIVNILIVSLDDRFSKAVSMCLSEKIDMFNADCKQLIEYDLISRKEVLAKCGVEYLKRRERGVLTSCAQYQDTVLSISYSLFRDNYEIFNNSLVIYLAVLPKKVKEVANSLAYKTRDEFLRENADIIIENEKKSKNNAVNKIIAELGGRQWKYQKKRLTMLNQ